MSLRHLVAYGIIALILVALAALALGSARRRRRRSPNPHLRVDLFAGRAREEPERRE